MDWIQIITLALGARANGIFAGFEFGTLGTGSTCLGLAGPRLAFDIAVHVGTLGAVLLYFRQHLFALARDACAATLNKLRCFI